VAVDTLKARAISTSVGDNTSRAACDAKRHANSTTAGWCSLDICGSRFQSGGAAGDTARLRNDAQARDGVPTGTARVTRLPNGTGRTPTPQSGRRPGFSRDPGRSPDAWEQARPAGRVG